MSWVHLSLAYRRFEKLIHQLPIDMKNTAPVLLLVLALTLAPTLAAQTNWTRQTPVVEDVTWNSVAFADADHGVVVGADGRIMRTTDGGSTWSDVRGSTGSKLSRVRFHSATNGHAVGDGGLLLRTTDAGATWSTVDAGTPQGLFDVWFFNDTHGMVAGQAGLLRATTDGGATWTARATGFANNNVYSITFATDSIGWICGNAGKIARTLNGGRTWNGQTSPITNRGLQSIAAASPTVVTCVGESGTLLHTRDGGRTWVSKGPWVSVPISSYYLSGVAHLDTNRVIVVGWQGLIVTSTDGGTTWPVEIVPDDQNLQGIHFVSERIGSICGWRNSVYRSTNGGGILSREAPPAASTITALAVHPQPARTGAQLTLSATLARAGAVRVSLHDLMGREVLARDLVAEAPGAFARTLGLGMLPPGVYVVRMAVGASLRAVPIVVR